MSLKLVPLVVVLVLGPVKLVSLVSRRGIFDVVAWVLFSAICFWICWAFWRNRDMPNYSGNFTYQGGENNFPRLIYVLTMVAAYFFGFFKG